MEQEFSHRIWFRPSDPYLAEFDDFKKTFGNDENILLIYKHPDGVFTQESVELVKKLTDTLWKTPNIVRVDSLSNYSYVRAEGDEIIIEPFLEDLKLNPDILSKRESIASEQEDIWNFLISKDKKTTVIYGRMRPIDKGIIHYNHSLKELRKKLKEIKFPDGSEFHIGGTVPLNVSFRNTSMKDLNIVMPLLVLTILFLLGLIFKTIKGIVFPALELIVTMAMTMGIAGWLGIKFSMIISMVPMIIAAIALADTIHILASYRENKEIGLDNEKALENSLRVNLRPTFLTTISTCLGFIGLTTADLLPIHDLGFLSAIGVVVAWLTSTFMVVPLLRIFPINFKPRANSKLNSLEYVKWLKKNRFIIISFFLLLAIGASYLSYTNKVNSNIIKYFKKSVPVRVANEFLKDNVGGYAGVQIVIDSGETDGIKEPGFLKKVASLQAKIQSFPEISKVASLVDVIKKMNKSLMGDKQSEFKIPNEKDKIAQEILLFELSQPAGKSLNYFKTSDFRKVRLDVLWTIDESVIAVGMIEKLRKLIKDSGLNGKVTGKAALITGLDKYIIKTFFSSILAAIGLVSLLMMFLFRSFTLGLFSMVPNVLPPVLGLGFLTLMGGNIDVGVILITSVCLGIAVDDTIYFFSHFLEGRKKGGTDVEILSRVINHSGKSLTYTTIILVLSFSTFVLGDFQPNRNFGLLTAFVLTMALVCDLVLLPVMLMFLKNDKKKN